MIDSWRADFPGLGLPVNNIRLKPETMKKKFSVLSVV